MSANTDSQLRERRKSARASLKAKMASAKERVLAAANQYNYDQWDPSQQEAFKAKVGDWGQSAMAGIKDIYKTNAAGVKETMKAKLAELEAQAGRPLTDEEKRQHIRQALSDPATQDKVRQWFADTKAEARDYMAGMSGAAKANIQSQAPGFTSPVVSTASSNSVPGLPPAPQVATASSSGYIPWDAAFGVVNPIAYT